MGGDGNEEKGVRRGRLRLDQLACKEHDRPLEPWMQRTPDGVSKRFFLICPECDACMRIVAKAVEVGQYEHSPERGTSAPEGADGG